ncbi:PLD nuclease N-terminal domain-containing protein [Microbacterium sp.]|uniref:PLD nuclease N-terminal domain-containing protein n=1 Tax=Microbacterium sp. TaxID=51671 RepID=UPI002E32D5E9|nr:PLD nuclease N-terminal domain-containing protein [Microbacterium sp.]HEX5727844.1 PLD nuclease N-terminal domain-containing protein [Microbacterium sp.]
MLTAIAILWFLVWVFVVVDIVRRPQFTTVKKIAWALIVLILPVVGVIGYLIVRPPDVSDRYGRASDAEPEERMRGSHPV